MRERLSQAGGFEDYLELIHFGRTSEDINNIAYALMLNDVRQKVLLPELDKIGVDLTKKANDYADIAMLAKTHGQPATPTTLGKELGVFVDRLSESNSWLMHTVATAKLNGATGTHAADVIAYPDINWPLVSKKFVEGLGLYHKSLTTQIEPHDNQVRFLSELVLCNNILTDLSRDIWAYISTGIFTQTTVKGEVGSSTMPHKVNPIDFENAEANFGIANALATHLAGKLPISRLQRDLTDSSAQRAFGEVFGHTLVALKSLQKGLAKIAPNREKIADELNNEWSILTEALQTIMRKNKIPNAYDIIKSASRGQLFTKEVYLEIVSNLDIPKDDKKRLTELTPTKYIGNARDLARSVPTRLPSAKYHPMHNL